MLPPFVPGEGGEADRPKRRVRYSGTHPRRFEEKYKELAPAEFPDEIQKVKARGATPAGTHRPIMLEEITQALSPLTGALVLDCTLGFGGHAEELAKAMGAEGRLIGLDRDSEELDRTGARLQALDRRITTLHRNFAGAAKILRDLELPGVDALLADLGVSSMQLDRAERGLSYKNNGPLDMRMDRSRGETAAEWIERQATSKDGAAKIAAVLRDLGDEPDSFAIADELVAKALAARPPRTTFDLAQAVQSAKGLSTERFKKETPFDAHPATRTFQALRMAVNQERESLAQLLRDLPWIMNPRGRVAILTFHSGEEALVSESLQEQARMGLWSSVGHLGKSPSAAEVASNPRARSARLFSAQRSEA